MKSVEIPGGTASLREPGVDPIPGNTQKVMGSAWGSLGSLFPDDQGLFGPLRPGETTEARQKAVEARMAGPLTPAQVAGLITTREATVVGLLKSWTLDLPLPTLDTIGGDDYAEVYNALLDSVSEADVAEIAGEPNFATAPLGTLGADGEEVPFLDSESSTTNSAEEPEADIESIPSSDNDGSAFSGEVGSREL